MSVFWFFLNLISAFLWFSWAFGFLNYDAWLVPFAFCLVGFSMVIQAAKSLVGGD